MVFSFYLQLAPHHVPSPILNSHDATTIYALPAEVLVSIFFIVSPVTLREWFSIIHVCRSWKFFAVNSPALWTYITKEATRQPRFLLTQLVHSRFMPIKVDLQLSPPLYRNGLPIESVLVLRKFMWHIHKIDIKAPGSNLATLFTNSRSQMHSLRSLSIEANEPNGTTRPIYLFVGQPIGFAPKLTFLRLDGVNVCEWPSLLVSSTLDTLIVKRQHNIPNSRPSPVSFFLGLSSASSLKRIEIDHCLPPYDPSQTLRSITLPAASEITICDDRGPIFQFFSLVKLPRTASVRLEPTLKVQPRDSTTVLVRSIRNYITQGNTPCQLGFHRTGNEEHMLVHTTITNSFGGSITLSAELIEDCYVEFVEMTVSALSDSHVTGLSITVGSDLAFVYNCSSIFELLFQSYSVNSLTLHGSGAVSEAFTSLKLLSDRYKDTAELPEADRPATHRKPSFQVATFVGVDFAKPELDQNVLCEQLRVILQHVFIKRFEFTQCRATELFLATMENARLVVPESYPVTS